MPGNSEARVSDVRFALLGKLMLPGGAGHPMTVPGPRQRSLLAALLLSANVPVACDALADAVWDGAPPAGAPATLRSHVRRLRQALGPQLGARITASDPGYLISVTEPELDVLSFGTACRDASAARQAARWPEASAAAARALELWRGAPLLDVQSQVLRDRFVPRLGEMRLQALEDRAEAELRLGHYDRLIPELRDLAAQHPTREQFQAQLMQALARAGRRAEALDAYRQARRALVDELGIDPGPQLQLLHQQILTGDPALPEPPAGHADTSRAPAPLASSASSPAEVPRQLPGAVPQFTGRLAELARLSQILDRASSLAPGTVVISAIGGTAGVGKTALAVYWAHQVASRFPDGQLYVDLRGYDPGEPMTASTALAAFLRALGVPGRDIPAREEERAARYRSLLAGRRLLVVLDNAGSAAQVRPLLPGAPGCMTVVTSRDSLAGLVARDGARRLDLGLLPPADAVGLLRALIGGRVDADPDAAAALAGQCSRLPLALRVAAELAAASPATGLADLVTELSDQRRRLDLLDGGDDPPTAVRAVFSWSYRHLDAGAARAFRLVGLHPGPDCDQYAAAALTGAGAAQAGHALAALARGHLVQQTGPGRYGMHDLLRAYARDLAIAEDGEDGVRAALTRLSGYYLHAAAVAMDTLFPAEQHSRPRVPQPATPVPPLAAPAVARAWLDTELAALVAIAAQDVPGHTARLAAILFRYLDTGGHFLEAVIIYGHARRAAHRAGDRAAEGNALTSLGVLDLRQGRFQQAATRLQEGLALFRAADDRAGEVRALGNLGILCLQEGRYHEATGHLDRAITLFRLAGDQTGEARALASLAMIAFEQGRYELAADHLQRALVIFVESDDRTGEAHALASLGEINLQQGQPEQAIGRLQRALELFREIGSRPGEARALAVLGHADLQQGRYDQAAERQRQSLAICRETRDRSGEASALNGLGEVLLAAGRPADARVEHTAALSVTTDSGERYEQARAHRGLARSYHAGGDAGQARHHWQQALPLYTALGAPEADEIRAQFSTADHQRVPPHG
jgi:DNA-binding SARP family transcriptional activator/Tfp pilus assembly protein PilF